MKRNSELLYWTKYKDMIHCDMRTRKYSFDPNLPERAKKSFLMWLAQN